MKKYTNGSIVRYFDNDVNVEDWIDLSEFWEMSEVEIDKHENPEKYLSDEEKSQLNRERVPTLKPIDFDIKLVDAGLYDQVQDLIQSDLKLRIAYTRATFFSRLDPFVIQASEALGLTPEQVDEIWTS